MNDRPEYELLPEDIYNYRGINLGHNSVEYVVSYHVFELLQTSFVWNKILHLLNQHYTFPYIKTELRPTFPQGMNPPSYSAEFMFTALNEVDIYRGGPASVIEVRLKKEGGYCFVLFKYYDVVDDTDIAHNKFLFIDAFPRFIEEALAMYRRHHEEMEGLAALSRATGYAAMPPALDRFAEHYYPPLIRQIRPGTVDSSSIGSLVGEYRRALYNPQAYPRLYGPKMELLPRPDDE